MSVTDKQFAQWAAQYVDVAGPESPLDFLIQGETVLLAIAAVIQSGSPEYEHHATSFLMGWLGAHWAGSTAVRLRAMTEDDDDTHSFRALLDKVRRHPHVFTRARYLKMTHAGSDKHLIAQSNKEWGDRYGRGDKIDPAIVKADIAAIDTAAAPVATFATKQIAHLDAGRKKLTAKYGPIYNCLHVLKALSAKYHPLFTGQMMPPRFGVSSWDARLALIPGEWKKTKD